MSDMMDLRCFVGQAGSLRRVGNPPSGKGGNAAGKRRLPTGAQDAILPHWSWPPEKAAAGRIARPAAIVMMLLCSIYAQAQPAKNVQELDRPLDIPDAELLNQRGEKIHFYSDLIKGHIVVIQSMFTTCTTLCPLLGAAFSRVQDILGAAGNVRLISISVDPTTDTPERLKSWGARYRAGPNWTLVTGNKYEVDRVLRSLKFYTADKLSHTALVLVGNEVTGRWARTSGFVPAARIAEMVKGLMQGTVCFGLPNTEEQPGKLKHAPPEASACEF